MTGRDGAGGAAERAARDLIARVAPGAAAASDVAIGPVPGDGGRPAFTVAADGGRLRIRATSGGAAASALRRYAARACGTALPAEGGGPVELPDPLPGLAAERVVAPWGRRYRINPCAYGYSAAFWDWPRWEREIDRMALCGTDLALCAAGWAAAWAAVLERSGVSGERAREHVGGTAFWPWAWLGCVHGHGAPPSRALLAERARLGARVADRMRALGIAPVVPGFAGHVPAELAARDSGRVAWMGFANRVLHPGDPRFRSLGLDLLREQEKQLGPVRYVAADPFVEGVPDGVAPAETARAVAGTVAAHRSDAVWVLQSWPFTYRPDYWTPARTGEFLRAVPRGRLLVLDLRAEHTSAAAPTGGFADHPWVRCALHDFGGRPGMHGALPAIAAGAAERFAEAAPHRRANLVGVGSAAESLAHDPAVEALLADVAWDGAVEDLDGWLRGHVRRRYGSGDEDLQAAWRILRAERYGAADPPLSVVQCRPRVGPGLEPDRPLNLAGPGETGPSPGLVRAWGLLLGAALRGAPAGPALRRDLVDVGDAVLTGAAALHRTQAADAFFHGDLPALESAGSALLARIAELDALAAALPERRLSAAAAAARNAGCAPGEGPRLRSDALRLLTVWVEPGHPLEDYAGRHWSGLLGRYYLPRWRLWTATLRTALTRAAPLSPARFDAALDAFEHSWLLNPATAPLRAPEDPVAVSERLYPRFAAAQERPGG